MNEREFIDLVYDLLANNTKYKPRERWQNMEANDLEDYWADFTDAQNPHIRIVMRGGTEYRLTLQKEKGNKGKDRDEAKQR